MSTEPRPHYLTTPNGQMRYWRIGSGPALLVLPGLVLAASIRAGQVAAACPGWTVICPELPGIGGSVGMGAAGTDAVVACLAEAATALGLAATALVSFDLAAPLAAGLAERLAGIFPSPVFIDLDRARAWVNVPPPPAVPSLDGAHLTSFWAFLRDRHIFDPADLRRAGKAGAELPTPAELGTTLNAAATSPAAYAQLWSDTTAAVRLGQWPDEAITLANLATQLAPQQAAYPPHTAPPPRPHALSPAGIWFDYVDTPRGRIHVRRAGTAGPPLIALHHAPGTTVVLETIIEGLAASHQVIAADFLGCGESDKRDQPIGIPDLAADALALADALGFERFDFFGTHTGALVGLELGAMHPDRIGRAVLEGFTPRPKMPLGDIMEGVPTLAPDRWGLHLQQAWNFRRDMFRFVPWSAETRAACRPIVAPDAAYLHTWVIGLLKSAETFHHPYRAAYSFEGADRLTNLKIPALVCAGRDDSLFAGIEVARRIAPASVRIEVTPATVWHPAQPAADVAATLATYIAFLSGGPH